MAFQISQGLFSPEFTDFHAVIGVSVEAGADEIRKRYLQVAKRLHPDSFASASPEERQAASELLSKLVNPAYRKLTAKEKDFAEYHLLLKLKGKEALRIGIPVLKSARALELQATQDWAAYYESAVSELASQQYAILGQTLNYTGEISELNLVYLMRREANAEGQTSQSSSRKVSPFAQESAASVIVGSERSEVINQRMEAEAQARADEISKISTPLSIFIEAYCRRAEDLMSKNQFSAAIKELRDALKDDPGNSRCHELMGRVYLKQNQLTMARISFDQALKFDPTNKSALEGKKEIEKLAKNKPGQAAKTNSKTEKPSSGMFGGLFGGRKK